MQSYKIMYQHVVMSEWIVVHYFTTEKTPVFAIFTFYGKICFTNAAYF